MKITVLSKTVAVIVALLPTATNAGSLEISPINIEVVAPAAASIVRIRNVATTPLAAQLRVFRWSQIDGVERLEPTNDVVASPPIATLAAGSEQTVRLIHVGPARQSAEESFRLVIDEVPTAATQRSGTVAIVVRHSLPVFFRATGNFQPDLSWGLEQKNGRAILAVRNSGQRRIRLAALSLRDSDGRSVLVAPGLAGYVLAGSTMRFDLPGDVKRLSKSGLTISAQGDVGPINAVLPKTSN